MLTAEVEELKRLKAQLPADVAASAAAAKPAKGAAATPAATPATTPAAAATPASAADLDALKAKIDEQGLKVRKLKDVRLF